MKRKTPFISALLAATLLLAPATPAAATEGSFFGDILGLFRQTFEDGVTQLQHTLDQRLGPLQPFIQPAIEGALGELGLIDPSQTRQSVAEQVVIRNLGDIAQSDPIFQAQQLANEVDRQLTRSRISTVLSSEGQSNLNHQIDWVEQTIGRVHQEAGAAQVAVSTQEAIKAMAQQNAAQAEVLGAIQTELLQAQQDAQLSNLNLTNISQSLDRESAARRLQDRSGAIDTLRISAQARLF